MTGRGLLVSGAARAEHNTTQSKITQAKACKMQKTISGWLDSRFHGNNYLAKVGTAMMKG